MQVMKVFRGLVFILVVLISLVFGYDRAVLAAAESAVKAPTDQSSMPLPLRVEGTRILNSKNEPVILRGVNTASLEWTSDGEGHILDTVRVAIDDWHVNHIRLPLAQDRWFGKTPEQDDEGKAYRALVDEIVNLCASKGCYIILDLHWSNSGQWGKNIGQHLMPDQNSVIFWKDLAPIYANHPAVLYDLYNEPHDVSWDVWLNGGTVSEPGGRRGMEAATYEAVGMQTLLDTIRATGAKNVVVAGGLDWAYDFSGILEGRQLKDPHGNGVIYANHAYNNKGHSADVWIEKMKEATAKFPVIVSEYGGSGGPNRRASWGFRRRTSDSNDDWLLHVMDALQKNNWHWTAWDLHTGAGPTLISDWNYTPTPDFGVYVKQALLGTLPAYTPPVASDTPLEEPAPTMPPPGRRARGLYGDWLVTIEFGDRQMESILSLSRNSEGVLSGQMINFWGLTELQDVKLEENTLSFIQVFRFGGNERTSHFKGTFENGTLSGILAGDMGESKLEGVRSRRIPRVAGKWQLKFNVMDREITAMLVIKDTPEGVLTAEWLNEQGEHVISDVQYNRGRLSFKRKSRIEDFEFESTFEGTIQRQTNTLTGIFRTDMGEIPVEGTRIGAALIGDWNLDVTSDQRSSKQRLRINQDLSGLYGIIPIKKVELTGDKVIFEAALEAGQQKFEVSFEGKISDSKLTGELKTPRGTRQVEGEKVVRTFERPNRG
ncbi:MAG: glycoside hydrolase family 5 protein [Sedimentisphaerales bacterium]|nr:glycoside hydrolase family 5 protein [Sedimentisphaerales bacterium]